MTYDGLVEFAKTWGLVYLVLLSVIVLIYAFWPGNRTKFERYRKIPLERD
jgi:cytochrome c oxidase cbb3-type subunit 4